MRRIIRLGSTYHTLDLSNTDDGTEYEPYLSPNAASLRALLDPLGVAMEEASNTASLSSMSTCIRWCWSYLMRRCKPFSGLHREPISTVRRND